MMVGAGSLPTQVPIHGPSLGLAAQVREVPSTRMPWHPLKQEAYGMRAHRIHSAMQLTPGQARRAGEAEGQGLDQCRPMHPTGLEQRLARPAEEGELLVMEAARLHPT